MTRQDLTHYVAACQDCADRCEKRNAQAWAHNHARGHGHRVALELGYLVTFRSEPINPPATPTPPDR